MESLMSTNELESLGVFREKREMTEEEDCRKYLTSTEFSYMVFPDANAQKLETIKGNLKCKICIKRRVHSYNPNLHHWVTLMQCNCSCMSILLMVMHSKG